MSQPPGDNPARDIWYEWLLRRRSGGDPAQLQRNLDAFLYPVRDRVLARAALPEGGVLLDVGCGDGLIAFGALNQVPDTTVIFSDISQDLLDLVQELALEMAAAGRCAFLKAPADDLSALPDASVDAVTTRSVLIYVDRKAEAFAEFFRVLKPGGRLSIFEPINRFSFPEPPGRFLGYDVSPVRALAARVEAVFRAIQPADTDPMLNFDERDLLALAEAAGFAEVHLELQAQIAPQDQQTTWDTLLHTAGNPRIPTLAEAIDQALSPAEAGQFTAYLRPLVESHQGIRRMALAYLWAVRAKA